jgi:hypothetical protein
MIKTRAKVFGSGDPEALDVTSLAPKTGTDEKAPPAEQVRDVAQAANFQSREPATMKSATKETKRAPRRYRTGRSRRGRVQSGSPPRPGGHSFDSIESEPNN